MSQPVLLTPAEYAVVVELMKNGGTNIELARALFVSVETVKCHLRRIYAKTGTADRTSLVVAIFRERIKVAKEGLVTWDEKVA